MQILFNEKSMQFNENITITSLLKQLKQLKPGTALALNQQILPREKWEYQQLHDGDQILLFQIIVGG